MSWALHQVDYAAASIFLNISSDGGRGSAPWWTRDDLQVAPGIEADVPVSAKSGWCRVSECGVMACSHAPCYLHCVMSVPFQCAVWLAASCW